MSALILTQTPGYVVQPASVFNAGQPINGLGLARVQNNADFAAVDVECFYQEVKNGDTVTLPRSTVDGYQYQLYECVRYWETRSTVLGVSGQPAAAGGLLVLDYWVDPISLAAQVLETYYVQGGASSGPIADGVIAVWTFGVRGRGFTTVSPSPTFTFQSDAAYATGQALTQSLLQGLNSSALFGAVRKEVFMLSASGTNWQPTTAYATSATIQPSITHANGCVYTAALGGTSGTVEPSWPTTIGAAIIDGSVIWNCTSRGFTNGQSFNAPVSPVDGYAYSSSDTFIALPSWIATAPPSGPSGAGRIQRLQKSVSQAGSSFTVNLSVTYWNGSSQSLTHDGSVNIVLLCERAMSAYPSTPPPYNVFNGSEFMTGQPLMAIPAGGANNTGQLLAENVDNAALRPEFFSNTGITAGTAAPVPTSPVSSYTYSRSESLPLWIVSDTGSVASTTDFALRLMLFSVDPATGLMNSRIDYNQSGGQATTTNGSFTVVQIASRQGNVVLSGVAVIPTTGSPNPIQPGGGNIIPNGSFELWGTILIVHAQNIGTPDDWSFNNATADGFITQQPGLDSAFAVGLNIGNAHGPSNTQFASILSFPAPIIPGDQYAWSILTEANPAITTGFIMRVHLRDINFSNDVYFDLIADRGLPNSVGPFSGVFTMPQQNDVSVSDTSQGLLPIVGTLNYVPVYLYVELWNFKPNVSSTVILDDLQIAPIAAGTGFGAAVLAGTMSSSATPLAQSGTSTTINVAATTWQFSGNYASGGFQRNYSAGSVNPGAFGTFYVYVSDPKFLGGSVTYFTTSNKFTTVNGPGVVFMGTITTSAGGGATGTGGGTGGGRAMI
jgi:hypothetical protein